MQMFWSLFFHNHETLQLLCQLNQFSHLLLQLGLNSISCKHLTFFNLLQCTIFAGEFFAVLTDASNVSLRGLIAWLYPLPCKRLSAVFGAQALSVGLLTPFSTKTLPMTGITNKCSGSVKSSHPQHSSNQNQLINVLI